MVQCEFCLNYNGIKCLEPKGIKFNQTIEDTFEHMNCPAYLEKGLAGLTGLGLSK